VDVGQPADVGGGSDVRNRHVLCVAAGAGVVVADADADIGGPGPRVVRPAAVEGAGLGARVEDPVRGVPVNTAVERVVREGIGRARIAPAVGVVLAVALVGTCRAGQVHRRSDVGDVDRLRVAAEAGVVVGDLGRDR